MTTLVLATRNLHKVEEIRSILGASIALLSLDDFAGSPNVIEDGATFVANATKKSVEVARWLSEQQDGSISSIPRNEPVWVLADDSGLEVDALGGEPGVHSARFAAQDHALGINSPTEENNLKLLGLLKGVPLEKRTARFRCVLALTPVASPGRNNASPVCYADEFEIQTEIFEGNCEGRIDFGPKGDGGFGYDPLFVPDGFEQTFAELGQEVKNGLSHRARALAKLTARLVAKA